MALTLGTIERTSEGSHHVTYLDITFDSAYPTGGEALTVGQLGLRSVLFFEAENRKGYNFEYDRANGKILAFNGTTQVANNADLSAVTTRVRAAVGTRRGCR